MTNVQRIKKEFLSCKDVFVQQSGQKSYETPITRHHISMLNNSTESHFLYRKESENVYIIYSKVTRNYYITDYKGYTVFKNSLPGKKINEVALSIADILAVSYEESEKLVKQTLSELYSIENNCNLDFVLKTPVRIGWRITDQCNLNCKHCFNYSNNPRITTIEQANRVIDQIIEANVFEVIITGGEATTHPYFLEIVNRLKKVSLTIFTNGILLPQYLERLKEFHIKFLISVDGFEKQHDLMRGIGTYRKVLKTIELLEETDQLFAINTVINKLNIDIMEQFIEFHKERGRTVQVSFIIPMGNANMNDHIILNSDDRIKLVRILRKYYGEEGLMEIKDKKFICGGGRVKVDILCDGSVTPCSFTDNFVLGNIYEASLLSIWENHKKTLFHDHLGEKIISGPCRIVRDYYADKFFPM